MDWFAKAFLKASLTWLGLGVTLGVGMAIHLPWMVYRPAHMHMNLLGFVAMMIFGVAYHVIPRFTGHALHSRRLAVRHWWVANAGLASMVIGFALRPQGSPAATPLLGAGGVLSALGAYVFIYNIWRTIDAKAPARDVPAEALRRAGKSSARMPVDASR
jgi:cbb3-type cytochrome oxidase subunit 1